MNTQTRQANMLANATADELMRELRHERMAARRQTLLKALWNLEQRAAEPSTRPTVSRNPFPSGPVAKREGRSADSSPRGQSRSGQTLGSVPNGSVTSNQPTEATIIMSNQDMLRALNELFAIENFSLARYLHYARPWSEPEDESLCDMICDIGDDQRRFANRVGSLIIERRGRVEGGLFSRRFTAFNDLSLDFMASRVFEDQVRIVRRVALIANQLAGDAIAHELALEILGAEHAHLDSLAEMLDDRTSDTGTGGTAHRTIKSEPKGPRCESPGAGITAAA